MTITIKATNDAPVARDDGYVITLDDSLSKYEEGVKLVRLCQKKLEQAKKKIEILVKTKDGKIKIEPFGEEGAKKK